VNRTGTPEQVSSSIGVVSWVNVAPDGRLLVLRPSEDQAVPPIELLTNWTALLERWRSTKSSRGSSRGGTNRRSRGGQ
jgi:hypothetical protein